MEDFSTFDVDTRFYPTLYGRERSFFPAKGHQMADDNVIPLAPRRMTEAEYEAERQRIRDTYGDSRSEAGGRWEQELAGLFWRSGWTQEEIAAREGKGRIWVQYRLRFGRFLTFLENVTTGDNFPILTERRFREYWEQRESGHIEAKRFAEVIRLIKDDAARKNEGKGSNPNPVFTAIREQFGDGKWHGLDAMTRHIPEHDRDMIERSLKKAISRGERRYKIERRIRATGDQYRIFPAERTVGTVELTEKLGPLIVQLKEQGRKNMATIAISLIAKIAAELQEHLDEWTK